MAKNILSVTQLNNYIKAVFDAEFLLHNIDVKGEVTNFSTSGDYAYFTLKDENAQIQCFCFTMKKNERAERLKNGDVIIATGSVSYYAKGGRLNFNVSSFKLANEESALLEALNALKEKLALLGYFDSKYKKSIPKFPKRIGVISSKSGAVIHDICNVAHTRNPNVDIILYDVKVQGEGAEKQIAKGIQTMDGRVDTIIIARGGGSLEDLKPFYSEEVCASVFNCSTPVVSAVGHEIDFSFCDLTADLRAATPSQAAELAVPSLSAMANVFRQNLYALKKSALNFYLKKENGLRLKSGAILFSLNNIYNQKSLVLASKYYELYEKMNNTVNNKSRIIENIILKLDAQNPAKRLKKGFARVFKDNKPVASVEELAVKDDIEVRLFDGQITARINDIKKEKTHE
jgi:exodeoxyribonuclease VII large subunit